MKYIIFSKPENKNSLDDFIQELLSNNTITVNNIFNNNDATIYDIESLEEIVSNNDDITVNKIPFNTLLEE